MTRLTEDLPTLDEGIMRGIRGGAREHVPLGARHQMTPKEAQLSEDLLRAMY
jgi:hypothetical protein